jgi:agmatine deiminase
MSERSGASVAAVVDDPSPSNPLALGFRMPAESAPHRRTWMQWPADETIYGDRWYCDRVRADLARLAQTIAQFEEVVLLARSDQVATAKRLCGSSVQIEAMAVDDMWVRDSGPTFVVNGQGEIAIVDLHFNAWGNKQPHDHDSQVVRRLAQGHGFVRFEAQVVMEGGAVEVDGAGTVLTTESAILNANRNTARSREVSETQLNAALGTRKVLWLPGLRGRDITDGHIDGLARFIRPGLVLIELSPEEDQSSEAKMARAAVTTLRACTDANGLRLEVVTIQTAQRYRSRERGFLNAYINYYVCNGAVILPAFGDTEADKAAALALAEFYPGRKIVPIAVDRIYENGGGIHCTTQQQPAGPSFRML